MGIKNWQGFTGEPKEVALSESNKEFEEVYNTEERSKFEGMKHITAQNMKDIVGNKIWSSYFTFSFVRNPWDRILSAYLKRRKDANRIVRSTWPNSKLLFNISVMIKYGIMGTKSKRQTDYITNDEGEIIVDFIGRFENLEKDFERVCSKIGVSASLGTNNDSTSHSDYREYYYSITKEIVKRHEIRDGNKLYYNF